MSNTPHADEEIPAFLSDVAQRAARWASAKTRQLIPTGPRALQRMSTQKLVAETARRGHDHVHWSDHDRERFAREYERRDMPQSAHAVREPNHTPEVMGAALAGAAASDIYDAGLIQDAVADTAANHGEADQLDTEVIDTSLTPDDVRQDMLDIGMSDETANAMAFAQQHSPDDLGQALAAQQTMPIAEVADVQRHEASKDSTLSL